MKYNVFKLFHIVGIAAWLGSGITGYFLILYSRISDQAEVELWLRQEYLSVIRIDATGLLIITASGLGMLAASKWTLLKQHWLRIKVYIALVVFAPLEFLQFYLYNFSINNASSADISVKQAFLTFDRFSVIAIIILTITVPVVLVLGVFKPFKSGEQ